VTATSKAKSTATGRKRTSSPSTGGAKKGVVTRAVEAVSNLFTGSSENDTNALDLLKADHDRVQELFDQVKANEDGDNSDTFDTIRRELVIHTHLEETIFYPYLLNNGDEDLQKITREGMEEHRQVKMFLEELGSMSGSSEAFAPKLKVLIEDVEHHVKEEEGEMFPAVRSQFSDEKLNQLGSEIEAEKARATGNAVRTVSA
jgi:hemerythrin superfamily protein